LLWVPDAAAAESALASADPSQASVVEGAPRFSRQQQPTELTVLDYREDSYKIRYTASAETLVRISVPYAPGLKARVDGMPSALLPVDYALSGVLVPAGQHELTLEFRPDYLRAGAALSVISMLGLLFLLLGRRGTEALPDSRR
ncbi:MAG TPA: YfhO family protein, partial [Bryobacteraceae bacterium]